MYVVGLTGGIGSGKTAVSDRFARLGICIVDADLASRKVVEAGSPALDKIRQRFGAAILQENGELNRAALRTTIFSSPADKQWLEELLHPLIFQQILEELQEADSPYVIFVSPLLVESGQLALCNRLLLVDAAEESQLQRTMQRDNNDEAQVRSIMASQASREERLSRADDVIVNDQGLDYLDQRVQELHRQYLELAAQHQQQ